MRVRYSFSSRRTRTIDSHSQHRSEFPAIVGEMLNKCEIILEILDARFIGETRNLELEREILARNKKIIYVLNKIDLADKQKVKSEIQEKNLVPYILVSCKERIGVGNLRERIKIEAKKIKYFPKVNIGVIGYPNTGKSSLINVLTGTSAAKTAAEPGFTKGIQKVRLSKNLFILDTPGVIPERRYSMQDTKKMAEHAKVSARGYDKVKEPEFVVHELMQQYPGLLEKFYNINAKGSSEEIIEQLGRKKHFLLKGNNVDTDRTARLILKDWQDGKIKV